MAMNIKLFLVAALLAMVSFVASAQDAKPYKEGPVTVVTSVHIKEGQFEHYMTYLSKTYKPLMEEAKKAGVIVDWGVYTTDGRKPGDPDMYLTVTYANMGSLDGLDEKMETLVKKVTGLNLDQADSAMAERGSMREILGSETIRQLLLN
jgi:hypothetical protein